MENVRKINIIIADNSKTFCNILNEYLVKQRDIIVTGIVNDGIELLKLIKDKKPDLVILNLIMPHLDSLEALERLNTMGLDMPAIIITSELSKGSVIQRALTLGADGYIVEPFELNSSIKTIREMFKPLHRMSKKG